MCRTSLGENFILAFTRTTSTESNRMGESEVWDGRAGVGGDIVDVGEVGGVMKSEDPELAYEKLNAESTGYSVHPALNHSQSKSTRYVHNITSDFSRFQALALFAMSIKYHVQSSE